jgi:hypothetical protein
MKEILTFCYGTHGHMDSKIYFWTTVDKLRHKISIPLFIVKIKYLIRYPLYFIFLKKKDAVTIGAKKIYKWHSQKKIILKASIISRWFPTCHGNKKASSVTDMLKKLAEKIWWII